jgi:oligoendopeptidase F
VYLRSEEDTNDHTDADADEALSIAINQLDAAVRENLATVGAERLHTYLATDPTLAPYRYFIDSSLAELGHTRPSEKADELMAIPTLDTLSAAYSELRRRVLKGLPSTPPAGKAAFDARWQPYLGQEDAFASLLLPIVALHNGEAKLQGFADWAEAHYFHLQLTSAEVNATLAAVLKSDANARYTAVVADAAAKHLSIAPSALHAWDLDAADGYSPAPVPFPDVVPMILAAEKPMGAEYAGQFAQLFDPKNKRVEWCHASNCDDTGFSVDAPGTPSGLYYGAYTGDTHTMRATAHEAGHAVHGEFRGEHQTLAVYANGPNFMGESFAIFNELLFLEHLCDTAPTPQARAYYLHFLLSQVSFEIWGSAAETDLERSIYMEAGSGKLHGAADLDALTLRVLAQYNPPVALDPDMRVYWARDRLFYTDPLYDVNYLYAGLMAVEYLHQLELDPKGFPARYVALLKEGFDDKPQALEEKFLGIDLDDPDKLVKDAATFMQQRTDELQTLYAGSKP